MCSIADEANIGQSINKITFEAKKYSNIERINRNVNHVHKPSE